MEDRPYLYKEDERADAMRDNLRKRKEQARAREDALKAPQSPSKEEE